MSSSKQTAGSHRVHQVQLRPIPTESAEAAPQPTSRRSSRERSPMSTSFKGVLYVMMALNSGAAAASGVDAATAYNHKLSAEGGAQIHDQVGDPDSARVERAYAHDKGLEALGDASEMVLLLSTVALAGVLLNDDDKLRAQIQAPEQPTPEA